MHLMAVFLPLAGLLSYLSMMRWCIINDHKSIYCHFAIRLHHGLRLDRRSRGAGPGPRIHSPEEPLRHPEGRERPPPLRAGGADQRAVRPCYIYLRHIAKKKMNGNPYLVVSAHVQLEIERVRLEKVLSEKRTEKREILARINNLQRLGTLLYPSLIEESEAQAEKTEEDGIAELDWQAITNRDEWIAKNKKITRRLRELNDEREQLNREINGLERKLDVIARNLRR